MTDCDRIPGPPPDHDLALLVGGHPDWALADWAELYISLGWPVMACWPGEKRPGTEHGVKDASLELGYVCNWFRQHPNYNIGLATGFAFDVLDVDVANGKPGIHSARSAERAGLLKGWLAMAATANSGRHLLYQATPDLRNSARARIGLDVKAAGGYIVAAPSMVQGRSYRWMAVSDGPHSALPWTEIRALLEPKPMTARRFMAAQSGNTAALVTCVATADEGSRNSILHWAAHRFVDQGLDPSSLQQAAEAAGLSASEARRTIQSVMTQRETP